MGWQECTLSRDEDIALPILNPLKSRLTGSTEGRGVHNFNRLWIDHCLSSLSTATFPLEEPEFETALCFGLTGVTLNRVAPLTTELDGKHLYGYHCRGLIGHTVVTISQGVMLGFKPSDLTYAHQFGALETAMVTDRPGTETGYNIQEKTDNTDDNTVVKITVEVKKRRH